MAFLKKIFIVFLIYTKKENLTALENKQLLFLF